MKTYYRVVITIAVIFLIGIVAYAILTTKNITQSDDAGEDIVTLNDIAEYVKDNPDDIKALQDKQYNEDYVVLDSKNNVIYSSLQSDKLGNITVERAVMNQYPYKYIVRDNSVVGSVIIINKKDAANINIVIFTSVLAGVIIVVLLLYGVYLNKRIIKPFDNMKEFALDVAEGRLDSALMMDKDNLFGAFTESFDIMREELYSSKQREIELTRREKELVASLSHDLKTPITGIKLSTELLKAKMTFDKDAADVNADMIEKIDNIYKKADQMDVLVNDLFASTLDDLGEFKVSLRDEDSIVLTDIVKKYDDKELANMGKLPEVLINIDVNRMSQVIGNIIANSYKYAGTKIDIEYQVIDDYLEMKIDDYGPGVPDEEISLVTNKFYRGKDWKNSNEDGNGLGLYISASLMEKMSGELIVRGGESGFGVTLLIPLS